MILRGIDSWRNPEGAGVVLASGIEQIARVTSTPPIGPSRRQILGGRETIGDLTVGRTVVNPRGHVYGVEQRVITDASVMPRIASANTNLPTTMVAERIPVWLIEQ